MIGAITWNLITWYFTIPSSSSHALIGGLIGASLAWQCLKCAFVNGFAEAKCQNCGASVRPAREEPARPPDPLDLISHDSTRVPGTGPLGLATKAVHTLTRVRRRPLIGHGLRSELEKRGETGGRAWQAIAEMPERDQHAVLDALVDHLEESGVALYRFNGDERD